MPLDFIDIDHIVIRAHSLNSVGDVYSRLGFTVTPHRKQVPQQSWVDATSSGEARGGTATINQRQVLFRPYPGRDDVANFLAFVTIEDQLNTPPEVTQMMSYMGDTEGPRAIVLNTTDVYRARDQLRSQGLEVFEPVSFDTGWHDDERDVFIPISSSACLPIHGQVPFMFDPFETRTLEGYLYPPWTEHPNGAKYFSGITGVTREVRRDAEVMAEKVFGCEVEFQAPDVAVLRRRDLFLRVVSPAAFQRLFPGLSFSSERALPHIACVTFVVESLDHLANLLHERGVGYVYTRDGLSVPREEGGNTLLEFVQEDIRRE